MERENQIIRLEITNDVNDSKRFEWFFPNTPEEGQEFIEKHQEEQEKWNYHTQGAQSFRYYDFQKYTYDQLMNMDISLLQGLTLSNVIEIIKRIRSQNCQ